MQLTLAELELELTCKEGGWEAFGRGVSGLEAGRDDVEWGYDWRGGGWPTTGHQQMLVQLLVAWPHLRKHEE